MKAFPSKYCLILPHNCMPHTYTDNSTQQKFAPKMEATHVKLPDASSRVFALMSSFQRQKENLEAQEQVLLGKKQTDSCVGSRTFVAVQAAEISCSVVAWLCFLRNPYLGVSLNRNNVFFFNKVANVLPIRLWYTQASS